ncbi:hypothetical protein D3C73_1178780 [compost metagenome]
MNDVRTNGVVRDRSIRTRSLIHIKGPKHRIPCMKNRMIIYHLIGYNVKLPFFIRHMTVCLKRIKRNCNFSCPFNRIRRPGSTHFISLRCKIGQCCQPRTPIRRNVNVAVLSDDWNIKVEFTRIGWRQHNMNPTLRC